MKKKTVNVYRFSELQKPAQDKARGEYIQYLMETYDDNSSLEVKKAVAEAEKMRTPWFTGEYIWEYAKKEVEWGVRQWDYYKDGSIFVQK